MKIRLQDGCFKHIIPINSLMGYDAPQNIEWERGGPYRDITVVTDHYLPTAHTGVFDSRINVAWLIEPAVINTRGYEAMRQYHQYYNYIISHDIPFLSQFPEEKRVFCPASGSSLYAHEWKVYPKTKRVMTIVGDKKKAIGHKLRYKVVEAFDNQIDVIGRGFKPFTPEQKCETLAPYMYQICIHNTPVGDYWSDILIDCIAVGTVPIVWGGHYLHKYFDNKGMILFNNLGELGYVLKNIVSEDDYESRREAIVNNFNTAFDKYRVIEDYLYDNFFKQFE